MTTSQSNAIHLLRVLALFSIVSCHICQFFGSKWAWVLNSGVQVFFVISGYLYGQREITSWIEWYKKRIIKLYIPYILYVLIAFLLYYIFERQYLKPYSLAVYVLDVQGVTGGGKRAWPSVVHDWHRLMLCYNSSVAVVT